MNKDRFGTRALRTALVTLALALLPAGAARAQELAPGPGPEPGAATSLDGLVASLSSPEASVRVGAVQALGERGEAAAVGALVQVLRSDPVAEVRGWAVRSLYQIGTPEARAAVLGAARQDPDERVRGMAARLTGVAQPPPPTAVAPAPAPTPAPVASPQVLYVTEARPPRPPRPPGQRLRTAGWAVLGSTYGLALLVGAGLMSTGSPWDLDWGWKLMIPIVGPVVASMTNWEGEEAAMSIWFWMWSAGQIAGVVLLGVGYYRGHQARQAAEATRRPGPRVAFAPGGPGGTPGLSLAGWW